MDLDFVSVHKHAKKELGQYPVILTSRLVNNPYIFKFIHQSTIIFLLSTSLPALKKNQQSFPRNRKIKVENYLNIYHCNRSAKNVDFISLFVLKFPRRYAKKVCLVIEKRIKESQRSFQICPRDLLVIECKFKFGNADSGSECSFAGGQQTTFRLQVRMLYH